MRVRALIRIFCSIAFGTAAAFASAQRPHSVDLGVSYLWEHANAPPRGCGCFSMQGGLAFGEVHVTPHLAAAFEFSGAHASNILNSTEELTVMTWLAGVRYTVNPRARWRVFGEAMAGGARSSSNFAYANDAFGGAMATGGGLEAGSGRVRVRVVDVDYLYTHLPNGTNNSQNLVRVSTGVVWRLR